MNEPVSDSSRHAPNPTAVRDRVGIVIPVASLSRAKSRLADVLTPIERRSLVLSLLDSALSAASQAAGVDEVLVMSPDPAILSCVDSAGAQGVRQRSRGLNPALREAEALLTSHHLTALIVLPIDLPLLQAEELERLVKLFTAARASRPCVGLVPDRHGTGTNLLLIAPLGLIAFRFGKGSRLRHRAAARQAGAAYVEFESPLKFDLDEPADLVLAGRMSLAARPAESPTPSQPRPEDDL